MPTPSNPPPGPPGPSADLASCALDEDEFLICVTIDEIIHIPVDARAIDGDEDRPTRCGQRGPADLYLGVDYWLEAEDVCPVCAQSQREVRQYLELVKANDLAVRGPRHEGRAYSQCLDYLYEGAELSEEEKADLDRLRIVIEAELIVMATDPDEGEDSDDLGH